MVLYKKLDKGDVELVIEKFLDKDYDSFELFILSNIIYEKLEPFLIKGDIKSVCYGLSIVMGSILAFTEFKTVDDDVLDTSIALIINGVYSIRKEFKDGDFKSFSKYFNERKIYK